MEEIVTRAECFMNDKESNVEKRARDANEKTSRKIDSMKKSWWSKRVYKKTDAWI